MLAACLTGLTHLTPLTGLTLTREDRHSSSGPHSQGGGHRQNPDADPPRLTARMSDLPTGEAMTENGQGGDSQTAPDSADVPATELTDAEIAAQLGVPVGWNPAFPLMTGESARAYLDPDADPEKRSPLQWAAALSNDDWQAKLAVWHGEAQEHIRAAMSAMVAGDWPTLDDCIPKDSILHLIDETFVQTTDIPRELPVFAAIHYVSALLLQRNVVISVVGEEWRPDIWTICMAESGSGKSFASSKIGKALGGAVDLFPDSSSAAKFVEDLRDHNRGLWMRDEFAQFLKSLSSDSMADTKDYLLRCYDGSTIVRSTKAETIEVQDPALTIFGSTVFQTIKDYLTKEMLVDGFAQRFAFVVAERDPERKLRSLHHFTERAPEISEMWQQIVARGLHSKYRVDRIGETAFEEAFQILLKRSDSTDVGLSFIKRISHRGMKYALIYHVLLGKESDLLDAEDFGFAAKLCALNLRDLRKVLDLYVKPVAGEKGAARDPLGAVVEELKKIQAQGGKAAVPSLLKSNSRPLRTLSSDEIRELMLKAVAADPSLAPFAATGPLSTGAVKPKTP